MKRHRRLTPLARAAKRLGLAIKWEFGGVAIGADDDPADTMNLQQRHALDGSRLGGSIRRQFTPENYKVGRVDVVVRLKQKPQCR